MKICQSILSDLDKETFRLNSQKEGYEEASEKQMNYMWEEYELTYNHAMELRNENADRSGRDEAADPGFEK